MSNITAFYDWHGRTDFKAIVYIASPYTKGDTQANVDRQRDMAHQLLDLGYCPIAPLLSHYLEEYRHRPWEDWMQMDLHILPIADCLLRLPGESQGADIEVAYAHEQQIPVFRSLEALRKHYETLTPIVSTDPPSPLRDYVITIGVTGAIWMLLVFAIVFSGS